MEHIEDIVHTGERIVVDRTVHIVEGDMKGKGIGKQLHEEPAIPCFEVGAYSASPKLVPGMVLAIEIMYNLGTSEVVYQNADGWTIATADGKISGLFEETVVVTKNQPVIITTA